MIPLQQPLRNEHHTNHLITSITVQTFFERRVDLGGGGASGQDQSFEQKAEKLQVLKEGPVRQKILIINYFCYFNLNQFSILIPSNRSKSLLLSVTKVSLFSTAVTPINRSNSSCIGFPILLSLTFSFA